VTVSIWEPEVTTDRLAEASSDDFVDLFIDQYPKLVGVLRVSGAVDKTAAEDIAQEAFARTLGHWRRVRQGTNPAGYVYRTAFRLLRRKGGLPTTPLDDLDLPETDAGPEHTAIANVTATQALAAMPPRRRACAALCWYLGFTSEEAADILGIDAATVRTHLERARRSAAARSASSRPGGGRRSDRSRRRTGAAGSPPWPDCGPQVGRRR
jgi:RNA polymerase sigma factor (sigma-70 family)